MKISQASIRFVWIQSHVTAGAHHPPYIHHITGEHQEKLVSAELSILTNFTPEKPETIDLKDGTGAIRTRDLPLRRRLN
ncbi:MAG: hypothetical protein AAF215_27725 [Cyanobacteria bacterium P01_A01_bin.123]